MAEDIEMIKAIANDSKVRINKIVDNYEELEKENAELKKVILKLQEQIESLTETLKAISTDTNEHITHNVAQNELDKWELSE